MTLQRIFFELRHQITHVIMDMSKAMRGGQRKPLPLSKPRTLGGAKRNLYQAFVQSNGPRLTGDDVNRLSQVVPSDALIPGTTIRAANSEEIRGILRDSNDTTIPKRSDSRDSVGGVDVGLAESVGDSADPAETNNRREAKRWCFTLNNPTEDDFPPSYEETQEVVPSEYFDYLLVGNEVCPTTGTPHLQGFICFKEKRRLSWIISNLFVSRKTGKGRASWRVCKGTVAQNITYCKKDGNFAEYGEPPKEGRGEGKASRDAVFGAALATGNVDSAMLYLAENAARDYCMQRQNLQRNFAVHFTPKVEYKPLYPLDSFNHIPLQFSNQHATLVWGETNCGKTAFVKAHFKNPLFCTHVDDLKEFKNAEHDAIIFDDMSFRHMPAETVIHLLETDNPASIHVRYGVVKIPPRVVKVFTHNTPNPFYAETVLEQHQKAIDRRFKRFHVGNKLY